MVSYTDKNGLLNLNLLEVYFLCDSKESEHGKEVISRLNEDKSIHNGLFHFNLVEKSSSPYEKLPRKLLEDISNFNVIIRLVNGIHHYYNYGLDRIDLNDDFEEVKKNVRKFLHGACEKNIENLEMLKSRETDSAILDVREYMDEGIIIEIFQGVIDDNYVDQPDRVEKSKDTILDETQSSLEEESLEIAQAAFGGSDPIIIEKDAILRTKPTNVMEVNMTLKKIPSGKRGTLKYGVVIDINGETVRVTFDNHDQTTVYFYTLICKKVGIIFKPSIFSGNIQKHPLLKSTYELIAGKTVNKWCNAMSDSGRRNNAKAQAKMKIWAALREMHPYAFYYCGLDFNKEKEGYQINIDREHIHFDEELMKSVVVSLKLMYPKWDGQGLIN